MSPAEEIGGRTSFDNSGVYVRFVNRRSKASRSFGTASLPTVDTTGIERRTCKRMNGGLSWEQTPSRYPLQYHTRRRGGRSRPRRMFSNVPYPGLRPGSVGGRGFFGCFGFFFSRLLRC